jgi:hypothetical protein
VNRDFGQRAHDRPSTVRPQVEHRRRIVADHPAVLQADSDRVGGCLEDLRMWLAHTELSRQIKRR